MAMKRTTAAAADEKQFITDDVTVLTILLTGSLLIASDAVGSHQHTALKRLLANQTNVTALIFLLPTSYCNAAV